MFERTSFQNGSLKKEKRKRGPDVWIFRWREIGPDGITRKPKVIVGSVEQFPTQSLAKLAVETLGLGINRKAHRQVRKMTMEQLIIITALKNFRRIGSVRRRTPATSIAAISRPGSRRDGLAAPLQQ